MSETRRGVWYGVAAYGLWGLLPLYWPLLKPSDPVEILGQRIIWSFVAILAILAIRRQWSWVRTLTRRQLLLLVAAAGTISINWGLYIYAVNTGHVVESALGYFINPLVSVLFGVVLFRERLRPWQWGAVGLAALAVLILTFDYGRPPWIALTLAASFGTYGLIKKTAQTGSVESLSIETLVLIVPAVTHWVILEGNGMGTFGAHGAGHALLLVSTGLVTLIPLLLFNAAAIRVPLSTVGLLQYIAPTLQFLAGVLIIQESMPPSRWIGFAVVWLALGVFTWDSLRTVRVTRAAQRAGRTVSALERV